MSVSLKKIIAESSLTFEVLRKAIGDDTSAIIEQDVADEPRGGRSSRAVSSRSGGASSRWGGPSNLSAAQLAARSSHNVRGGSGSKGVLDLANEFGEDDDDDEEEGAEDDGANENDPDGEDEENSSGEAALTDEAIVDFNRYLKD